jgi:hypothetical protein
MVVKRGLAPRYMECKSIGGSVIEICFVGNPHVSFNFGLLY